MPVCFVTLVMYVALFRLLLSSSHWMICVRSKSEPCALLPGAKKKEEQRGLTLQAQA